MNGDVNEKSDYLFTYTVQTEITCMWQIWNN